MNRFGVVATTFMALSVFVHGATIAEGPCNKIKQVCTSAGFVADGSKSGKGLWVHCINPAMEGVAPQGSTLPLPSIDPTLIAACKQKNPRFGMGKVGSQGKGHPCEQVKEACQAAGFIQGQSKVGKGLWKDCINPVIQQTAATNATLPLPSMDPNTIAACRQKNPKFGRGKAGS